MPVKFTHTLHALVLLAAFAASKASASDFSDLITEQYKLKPLSTASKIAAKSEDKVTIAMVYQPDCKWCKKQGQWLAKAHKQCNKDIDIVLIGNNGKKQQLKRELKHFHRDIPAFQANRKLLTAVGGVEASPTTLVFNEQGALIAKQRGFVKSSKLADVANIISKGKCDMG